MNKELNGEKLRIIYQDNNNNGYLDLDAMAKEIQERYITLKRPLDSELEESFNKMCKAMNSKVFTASITDVERVRQALTRLTPKITADEIVKELREIYPTKTRQYEIEFENKKYRISDDEFKNGVYMVKLEHLPLKLAHKITTFFIQESESE